MVSGWSKMFHASCIIQQSPKVRRRIKSTSLPICKTFPETYIRLPLMAHWQKLNRISLLTRWWELLWLVWVSVVFSGVGWGVRILEVCVQGRSTAGQWRCSVFHCASQKWYGKMDLEVRGSSLKTGSVFKLGLGFFWDLPLAWVSFLFLPTLQLPHIDLQPILYLRVWQTSVMALRVL